MHHKLRKLSVALAAVAVSATVATTAEAATTTVKLHTQGDLSKSLSDRIGIAEMIKSNTDANQKWRRTDTSSGYATYRNLGTNRCLTGRGLTGLPVVSVEACVSGATRQQWRLGVSGELQLRLNGLVAKHNLAGTGSRVEMSIFLGRPEQKWHTHAA